MGCKINYIEKSLRDNNPKLADELNEKHVNIFRELIKSKLFKIRNNQLYVSKEGSKRLESQELLIDKINNKEQLDIITINDENIINVNVINQKIHDENNGIGRLLGTSNVSNIFEVYPSDKKYESISEYNKNTNTELENLTTLEGELQHMTDVILDVIDSQKEVGRKRKRDTGDKYFDDKISKIKKEIEDLENINQIKGIVVFTKYMKEQIELLNKRVNDESIEGSDTLELWNQFESYSAAYSLIDDVIDLFNSSEFDKAKVSKKRKNNIQKELNQIQGGYISLHKKINSRKKNFLRKVVNHPKYHADIEQIYKNKLKKEAILLFTDVNKQKEWINKKLNSEEYQEDIQFDIDNKINDIFKNIGFDISNITRMVADDLNTNSKLVQILSNMLSEIRDEIVTKSRDEFIELDKLFDKFKKGKNTFDLKSLYGKILDYDSDGNAYLYSKYKPEFINEKNKQLSFLMEAQDEFGEDSDLYEEAKKNYYKWLNHNTIAIKGKNIPIDKWKNNIRNLTDIEQEVLDKFKNLSNDSRERTKGYSSLIQELDDVKFYKLPSIHKSDLERISQKDIKGVFTEKITDLKEIRADDVGFTKTPTTINNTPINFIPIHYRGKIDPKNQSIDLFTIYALDFKNTLSFEIKSKKELEIQALLDISKNKKFYKTEGLSKRLLRSFSNKRVKSITLKGEKSNTFKKMEGMIENQIYDISNKYAGRINNTDVNKVVKTVNGYTAILGLGMNFMGGFANPVIGNMGTILEAISSNVFSSKNLNKAIKIYTTHLGSSLNDIGNSVKKGRINQINEMFDVFGHNNIIGDDFLKNTKMRSMLNSSSLTFMYSAGEHQIQSVLTLTILDSIKVMNKNSDFIDKNGNKTSYKKSASLLDMLKKDKDGKLYVNKSVVYTEFTPTVPYNEGGKVQINNLIKKKIFDTQGVYDNRFKNEVQREWWGSLVFLYRRYLISSVQRHLKGHENVNKPWDELDGKLQWNEALKEYDEGTYITTTRFFLKTLIPALKKFQYSLIKTDWKNMSDLQRGNIRRTMVELILTTAILPTLSALFKALGEEEDERFYYLAYQVRRLDSELSQYRNLNEAWRLLQSPAASVRSVQNIIGSIYSFMNIPQWDERYGAGKHKNELRIKHTMIDLLPVIHRYDITAKESFNWFDR